MDRRPRIGEVRQYDGAIGVLYPGERAQAVIKPEDIEAATAAARACGLTRARVPSDRCNWLVEPEPGIKAAYRRVRYRLIGQWYERFMDWWRSA